MFEGASCEGPPWWGGMGGPEEPVKSLTKGRWPYKPVGFGGVGSMLGTGMWGPWPWFGATLTSWEPVGPGG